MTDEQVSLRETITPNSNQLNADDLIGTTRTVTVTKVTAASGDQPVSVYFDGDNGKPYKPCKSMRRVLIFAWGDDGRDWVGRSMTLFSDPTVKFGGVMVGGIRISHLTNISGQLNMSLTTTRAKRAPFVVSELKLASPAPAAAAAPKQYQQDEFNAKFPAWESAIEVGALTAAVVISKAEQSGGTLTDAMKASINAVKIIPQSTPQEDF